MRMRVNYFLAGDENRATAPPAIDDEEKLYMDDKHKLFGFSLAAWYKFALFVTTVLFGFTVGMYAYRSQNPSTLTTSRMGTPLTRTVGLWVSQGVARNHSFDDLVFGSGVGVSDQCEVFRNTTQSFSTLYVRPVTLSVRGVYLDTGLFMVIYLGISMFCYFYMLVDKHYFYKNLNDGSYSVGSYAEQALTIPFMLVILCAQMGVTDLGTVLGVVSCAYSSVIFRCIAEELQFTLTMLVYWKRAEFYFFEIAHFTGLMSLAFAFAPLFLSLNTLGVCFRPNDAFSTVIETVLLVFSASLLGLHGIQWYSIEFGPRRDSNLEERVKWCYNMEYINTLVCLFLKVFVVGMIYPINFAT
jgi:hypothetical protein